MDETWHFVKDVIVIFIIPWCIWVTLRIFDQDKKQALGEQSIQTLKDSVINTSDEMKILDTEVKAELKEINKKVDDMPSKIVELLRNN